MEPEKILEELKITEEVVCIFPYGSHVYGTAGKDSDHDYIIVTKGAQLSSGAFRQNAISNEDRSIQAVLYSRGGFIDAINNYEIGALECLFLDKDQVIMKKWPFKIQKWDEKEMVKRIISKASASWHAATKQSKGGFKETAKRGIFHALRILYFGLQLKEHKKIVDYGECNKLKETIFSIDNEDFDDRQFISVRDELIKKLKK